MRIISGKYKGKRLTAPKKLPVRPTSDMAKEALFNILNNYFNFFEIETLELFAGTGNISFEFASRGVKNLVAVDLDAGCTQYIHKIAEELDFNITVIKSDVFKFLEKNRGVYDIIFADPPYDIGSSNFEKLCTLVFEHNILSEDGFFIVEHSKDTKLEHMPYYSFQRNYGGTTFSFFEHEQEGDEEDE